MVLWCNWLALWTLNPAIRVQIPVGPPLGAIHIRLPPWLSWQSARLLTDRSLVRAQVEAALFGSPAIPVCQSGLADLHLVTTVFHLLTCLELYEGVKKFHPNLSERAGFGGAPGLTACRVANLTSTAIERTDQIDPKD